MVEVEFSASIFSINEEGYNEWILYSNKPKSQKTDEGSHGEATPIHGISMSLLYMNLLTKQNQLTTNAYPSLMLMSFNLENPFSLKNLSRSRALASGFSRPMNTRFLLLLIVNGQVCLLASRDTVL